MNKYTITYGRVVILTTTVEATCEGEAYTKAAELDITEQLGIDTVVPKAGSQLKRIVDYDALWHADGPDTTPFDNNNDDDELLTLYRDNVCVQWINLNEGETDDYDPSDPSDTNYLRFQVLVKQEDGSDSWEQHDDGSCVTNLPADTNTEDLKRYAETIMDAVYPRIQAGASIKKICEAFSHLPADDCIEKYAPNYTPAKIAATAAWFATLSNQGHTT